MVSVASYLREIFGANSISTVPTPSFTLTESILKYDASAPLIVAVAVLAPSNENVTLAVETLSSSAPVKLGFLILLIIISGSIPKPLRVTFSLTLPEVIVNVGLK